MSSPASLPKEIQRSAERGELQKVVKWLRKGGAVDALGSTTAHDGSPNNITLLHVAAANDHVEMVKELLKRGASMHTLSLSLLVSNTNSGTLRPYSRTAYMVSSLFVRISYHTEI